MDATWRVSSSAATGVVGAAFVTAGVLDIFSGDDASLRPALLGGLGILYIGAGALTAIWAREDLLRALNEPTAAPVAAPTPPTTPPATPAATEAPPPLPSAPPEGP